MSTMTLNLDLADESGIQRAINALQHLLGKAPSAPHPDEAVSSQTTAKAGAARAQTGSASSPAAASAVAASQASTAATGDAGNAAAAAGPSADAANASSDTQSSSPAPKFEEVKKAFLALSTKPGGRALCESVLKAAGLAKLSEAKPEQFVELKAAIDKAAA